MNNAQLMEDLRDAQMQRETSGNKLAALVVMDPIERAPDYDKAFAQAMQDAHVAHLREQAILFQLYPETRPDDAELDMESQLRRIDEELAQAQRFWRGVPGSVGPGRPLPVLNGDELPNAPTPDLNPLHRLRQTVLFELERYRAPRLERYYSVRESHVRGGTGSFKV